MASGSSQQKGGGGQADREMWLVKWPSDLKEDDLQPWKLTGHEELGKPFRYELLLLSNLSGVKPDSVVGNDMTVRLDVPGLEDGRHFNGYVSAFENVGTAGKLYMYRAVLRPWTWFLEKRSNCRVFQGKSSVDILKAICGEDRYKGYSLEFDVSVLPKEACRKREYCVQYRESDFDFVSRLLEEEGIYYYFVHEKEKHKMLLCCDAADHGPYFGSPSDPGDPIYYTREVDNVDSWVAREEITAESFRHRDYDFQNPSTYLENQAAEFDVYEYPARCAEPVYEAKDGGKHARDIAGIRSEELKALASVVEAETRVGRGLVPGHKFKMEDHPDSAQNKEYLVVTSDLEFEGDDYGAQVIPPGEQPAGFSCKILAIPAATQFRPARTTPGPRLPGLQTATVVGDDGSTADLGKLVADKVGRVRLRFHWDLEAYAKETGGKGGEYHFCPVRVAQPWAGCGFGALFMPRVGDEVVVAFIDGDPDRPLVVGSVYNGVNASPYDPAQMATVSTIQSRSIDTTDAFNEIRLDDKKGEEQLFMHAEKDLDVRAKNDSLEWIGNERHLVVKVDQLEMVEGEKHSTVKGNRLSKVDGDSGEAVKGARLAAVDADDHLAVKGAQNVKVDGDANLMTDGNLNQEAGMTISVKSGQDFQGKAGMNYAMEAGMAVHIKGGTTVVIEGGLQLSLKAGPSFVDIGPAGVAISGPMVMINSGGSAGSGAGSAPTAPAKPDAPDPPKEPREAAESKPAKTEKAKAGKKDVAAAGDSAAGEVAAGGAAAAAAAPAGAAAPPPPSPAAEAMQQAAEEGAPFCEKCEEARKKKEAEAGGGQGGGGSGTGQASAGSGQQGQAGTGGGA